MEKIARGREVKGFSMFLWETLNIPKETRGRREGRGSIPREKGGNSSEARPGRCVITHCS